MNDYGPATEERDPKPTILGAASIFAPLPPVPWVCEALDFAPGAPLMVAGCGNSAKTLAAQDFLLSCATGQPAWGRFQVRACKALHLDYEQGSPVTRLRYQRLARARGISKETLEGRIALAPMPRWFLDDCSEDRLRRLSEGFDLVLIDSFRAACQATDENSSDARLPLDRLTRHSESDRVSYMVIHHARKPSANDRGGSRAAVRGSGALYDACGSVLMFSAGKNQPVKVTHEKARITGRPHPDFGLRIEDVSIDGDPTAGVRITFLDSPLSSTAPASTEKFADLKSRILVLVRQSPQGLVGGIKTLRARLGGRTDDVQAALDDLIGSGILVRGGTYHAPVYSLGSGAPG